MIQPCPQCKGAGFMIPLEICTRCGGDGWTIKGVEVLASRCAEAVMTDACTETPAAIVYAGKKSFAVCSTHYAMAERGEALSLQDRDGLIASYAAGDVTVTPIQKIFKIVVDPLMKPGEWVLV